MAKKYLTLDEAASRLGIEIDHLQRLREEGEIRGFADRGSWKFREQDVEEFARSLEADSSPDIPIISAEDAQNLAEGQLGRSGEDSGVHIDFGDSFFDDEDDSSTPPEVEVVDVGGKSSESDDDDGEVPIEVDENDAVGLLMDDGEEVKLVDASNEASIDLSASDSDVRLAFDDSFFDSETDLANSDSDVQLAGDSKLKFDADEELNSTNVLDFNESGIGDADSDSDVQLVGTDVDSDIDVAMVAPGAGSSMDGTDADADLNSETGVSDTAYDANIVLSDSDSDVRLTEGSDESAALLTGKDSDSDVAAANLLTEDAESDVFLDIDSDSDVHLVDSLAVAEDDSDSDVMLNSVGSSTESDIRLMDVDKSRDLDATMAMDLPEDSDLKLIDSGDSPSVDDDSGISLEFGEGMLSLDADESGISLEADDSGISLESLDSGVLLGDDSGITLDVDDSGLTLEAADSGIALFDDDSGISLDADEMGHTQPMSALGGGVDLAESNANTMEMNLRDTSDNDSEFELAGLDDDDDDFGTDTSVLMFDDDDAGDEFSVASQKPVVEDDLDVTDFAADESFENDLGDDGFEDDFEEDEMDDVWDAEDEDTDDGFEAGETKVGGFTAPSGGVAGAGWMVQDQPWGGLWTTFVSIGALFSIVSAFVGIELVRTMWLWTQPGEPTSGLLGMLGGMFGK